MRSREYAYNVYETLHDAALHGDLDSVKSILAYGEESDLDEALCSAVNGGHLHVVKYLLDLYTGPNINYAYGTYGTPLLIAVQSENYIMADFLISEGADPNLPVKQFAYNGNIQALNYLVDVHHANIKNTESLIPYLTATGQTGAVDYIMAKLMEQTSV